MFFALAACYNAAKGDRPLSNLFKDPAGTTATAPGVVPVNALDSILGAFADSGSGYDLFGLDLPGAPADCDESFSADPDLLISQAALRVSEELTGMRARPFPEMTWTEKQIPFRDSQAVFRIFVGGQGCGKSRSLMQDLLLRAKGGRLYVVVGPTYRTLCDATYRTFKEVAGPGGQDCILHTNKTDFSVIIATRDGGQARINFRSADNPDSLRGPNISGLVLDEGSLMHEDALTIAMACLREAGEMGWVTLGCTPKGKQHWTYTFCFDEKGNPKPDTELFRSSMRDNPFLARKFVNTMEQKYVAGSTMARQELEGDFVNLGGLMFQRSWFLGKMVNAVPKEAVRVRYWDKASSESLDGQEVKGDWSAGILVAHGGDGRFYVEDVVHGQWGPSQRNKIIRDTAARDSRRYGNTVVIWVEQEPGSGGKESALISAQELAAYPVFIDRPIGDKPTRARPLQAQAEVGNVYIVTASWNEKFLDELTSFGAGAVHDDMVDGAAGAYNKVALASGLEIGFAGALTASPAGRPGVDGDGKDEKPLPHTGNAELDLIAYLAAYAGVPVPTFTARLAEINATVSADATDAIGQGEGDREAAGMNPYATVPVSVPIMSIAVPVESTYTRLMRKYADWGEHD